MACPRLTHSRTTTWPKTLRGGGPDSGAPPVTSLSAEWAAAHRLDAALGHAQWQLRGDCRDRSASSCAAPRVPLGSDECPSIRSAECRNVASFCERVVVAVPTDGTNGSGGRDSRRQRGGLHHDLLLIRGRRREGSFFVAHHRVMSRHVSHDAVPLFTFSDSETQTNRFRILLRINNSRGAEPSYLYFSVGLPRNGDCSEGSTGLNLTIRLRHRKAERQHRQQPFSGLLAEAPMRWPSTASALSPASFTIAPDGGADGQTT